jgi:hypothetical protein
LAEFHSKVLIAQAFGVIPYGAAQEYHRIKAVRNVFAHAVVPVTFDTEEIAKEVDSFSMWKAMQEVRQKHKLPENELRLPRKALYLLMCEIVCIMIDHERKEITGEFLRHYEELAESKAS